ncbi:NAD-dependent epimerase [Pseudoxanthomonas spadix]|uniref:NAD-dependent epimerase n=1 Tax=Pseudoxanthomonas spadix TaxID=415229 RepID=UPI000EFDD369|nr:NAD-dependent epimerase [Pseudoxanthomonas spadix]MBP3975966.1 NAD-dependent epimerase [Pseudoxanthomonas spadix]RMW96410.1 NAD-dependent epimerase [Pseudoxanthomonas spadix]
MKILVTGAAGFIGARLSERLLERGDTVLGYDNLNDYYDPSLKEARLHRLQGQPGFAMVRGALEDRAALEAALDGFAPQRVVNLAAQAGVRYSLQNPHAYIQSNIVGFMNVLEACRHRGVEHLVYASSSSVYGGNRKLPFAVEDSVDHPLSLYAASKKANELMAHTYSHLYRLPTTGLRFFTVYGPWGRPDMALFQFTQRILAGEPIELFNNGQHTRDFTYIDDIVEGVIRTLDHVPGPDPNYDPRAPNPATSDAPYRVYNIGNNAPVQLLDYIEVLEDALGRKAQRRLLPLQPGDVPDTFADVSALQRDVGYAPSTPIQTGIVRFVQWYRTYYKV